jgi:hypothetical protein
MDSTTCGRERNILDIFHATVLGYSTHQMTFCSAVSTSQWRFLLLGWGKVAVYDKYTNAGKFSLACTIWDSRKQPSYDPIKVMLRIYLGVTNIGGSATGDCDMTVPWFYLDHPEKCDINTIAPSQLLSVPLKNEFILNNVSGNSVSARSKLALVPFIKTSQLKQFREITAVCSGYHTKRIKKMYAKSKVF